MEDRPSFFDRWFYRGWGFPHFIVLVFLILVIILVLWLFSPSTCPGVCSNKLSELLRLCDCTKASQGADIPPDVAVGECRRQLDANSFSIPGGTAHERTLIDSRPSTNALKNPVYVYVAILKRASSQVSTDIGDPASPANVFVEVHRPNDRDHTRNLEAYCAPRLLNTTPKTVDGAPGEEQRWEAFCNLTALQNDTQEAETGSLKYRVLIKNWSGQQLNYCFVSSCDVRYPAGRPCSFPSPGQTSATGSFTPP